MRSLIFTFLCMYIALVTSFKSNLSNIKSKLSQSKKIYAVAAKSDYLVTLLPGDGIGPEIIKATVPSLVAIGGRNGFSFTK